MLRYQSQISYPLKKTYSTCYIFFLIFFEQVLSIHLLLKGELKGKIEKKVNLKIILLLQNELVNHTFLSMIHMLFDMLIIVDIMAFNGNEPGLDLIEHLDFMGYPSGSL